MTRPFVQFPDAERLTVDLLKARIADHEPDVTVSVGVPKGWEPDTHPPHLQVAWDGTPWQRRGILARTSIRIVAWSDSTSESKRLALLAQGLLDGHSGGGITEIRSHIGVMPTRDLDTGRATPAELAWFTLGVTVRSEPIPEPIPASF